MMDPVIGKLTECLNAVQRPDRTAGEYKAGLKIAAGIEILRADTDRQARLSRESARQPATTEPAQPVAAAAEVAAPVEPAAAEPSRRRKHPLNTDH